MILISDGNQRSSSLDRRWGQDSAEYQTAFFECFHSIFKLKTINIERKINISDRWRQWLWWHFGDSLPRKDWSEWNDGRWFGNEGISTLKVLQTVIYITAKSWLVCVSVKLRIAVKLFAHFISLRTYRQIPLKWLELDNEWFRDFEG